MSNISLKQEFIQDYGEGYHHFGLPKLMGRIVGLLLYEGKPLTLDYITKELNVSKGPVSQITRRLREHALIQRKWIPGDRKDYYETVEDIFGKAFLNRISLMHGNLELAEKYCLKLAAVKEDEDLKLFKKNIEDMKSFYTLMIKHYNNFLEEWTESQK
ncbi:MAG: MarR family transcriptional regulator [Calditrichaeota bacterium]|nr:MAG: MarR family transcriptional regulator [Calditrichota bacterium]MBL1206037.1 MarR family transcriptional regulator [Calditrichota bacterium]NOG45865.1 MarR family transcriptional regulator [Calditrichota bacterium]